jgi:hypothetical protein
MLKFTNEQFEEIKTKGENFYKDLVEVHCPYFQEKIHFNAKGLEHLKFKKKNFARSRDDQYIRFKLLHLAPEILKLSKTVQGISHTKSFEFVRSGARTELKLLQVSYYEFIAVLKDIRVRIIVKQIEESPKFFWSIIPFWKVNKQTMQRKMHSGNLEMD